MTDDLRAALIVLAYCLSLASLLYAAAAVAEFLDRRRVRRDAYVDHDRRAP